MRFILNFIFFALLFYAIYFFFPDAFQTMVTWVRDTFAFIKAGIEEIVQKYHGTPPPKP